MGGAHTLKILYQLSTLTLKIIIGGSGLLQTQFPGMKLSV
jgi:hypothetical protein